MRFNNIITGYLVKIRCGDTIMKFNPIVSLCHFVLNFCQTRKGKAKNIGLFTERHLILQRNYFTENQLFKD